MSVADEIRTYADERSRLLADRSVHGVAFVAALNTLTTSMVTSLGASIPSGWALGITGGLTRAELCPGSDLDLFLVHPKRLRGTTVKDIASSLWYPLWDAGINFTPLTHTVESALESGRAEYKTATALLDLVAVAGEHAVIDAIREQATKQWQKQGAQHLKALADATDERHNKAGEVAFLLEPDLKDGRGGLRDLHTIRWALATGHPATLSALDVSPGELQSANDALLQTRAVLHRLTKRNGDRLLLQEQDGVAQQLRFPSADDLMRSVAQSARTVAWASDRFWFFVRRNLRRGTKHAPRAVPLAPGFVNEDGVLALTDDAVFDSSLPLRAGAAAALNRLTIDGETLQALATKTPPLSTWTSEHRRALVSLLGAGHDALPAFEALDRFGLIVHAMPEWETVQSKPQRNAFHRFTVDRHLCEAAANSATWVRRVARPDLLLLGTWLHDIGKGFPGDHTEVGEVVITTIATRMGYERADIDVLVRLCRHHLLLPETATRRDLSDPGTIHNVADAVETSDFADLLHAVTVADSMATGPSAWSEWKAGLVRELTDRVKSLLAGHQPAMVTTPFTPEHHAMAERVRIDDIVVVEPSPVHDGLQRCTIAARDQLGLLRDIAGVLSVHGVEVLSVDAWTTDDGIALDDLVVARRVGGETNWAKVRSDLKMVNERKLDVAAKIADRARTYANRGKHLAAEAPRAEVLLDSSTSSNATIVEVRAPDSVGVLWRLASVLTEFGFDIPTAKVVTLGHEVVDVFYVRQPGSNEPPVVGEDIRERLLLAATSG